MKTNISRNYSKLLNNKKNIFAVVACLTTLIFISAFLIYLTNSKMGTKNSESLVLQWLQPCTDTACVTSGLEKITAKYGPQSALDSLELYKTKLPNSPIGDEHQRAHEIGRQTAKTYGVTGKAFLDCPLSFNYGCQHGFFEKALGQFGSARDAIEQICGKFEGSTDYSPKFQFYCYHGVGHGVMMSQAFDLKASLSICDELNSQMAQTGCWQGVFMENVNAEGRDEARKETFLAENPLAPCNVVLDKYQHECYINHAGYLLGIFKNDIVRATDACLRASALRINTCLESIGLTVTNEDKQKELLGKQASANIEKNGWKLCQQFPIGHVESCVLGAVDHILQMDEVEVGRANVFCNLVDVDYEKACYGRIGIALRAQTLDAQTAKNKCMNLAPHGQSACLQTIR